MNNERFIKKMISHRKKKKVSQETLSEWLNISSVTLYQIERGKAEMDINMCLVAAEKLDIPVSEIFAYKRERTRQEKIIMILAAVAAVLLLINVAIFIGGKMMIKYNVGIYYYCTIVGIEDNLVTLSERYPSAGSTELQTYVIRIDEEEQDDWEGNVGDIVVVWYHTRLSAKKINPSSKIIGIEIRKELEVH